MVCSSDSNTNFFNIDTGVLQGDTFAYIVMICQDYIPQISIDLIKENGFTLKKTRSKWYFAEIMTDANYTDNLVLLPNTAAQTESQLYSLKQTAGRIK